MKNTIQQLPKNVQVILSCICRKWQSDFLDKSLYEKKWKKSDYEKQVAIDRKFIEELTKAKEDMND